MRRLLTAAAAAAAIGGALTGCATPTPYQPALSESRYPFGYRDQKLDADNWRVSFSGNSVTKRETVENYLLYRAAELTVQQGYDWFAIVDRETDRKSRTYVDPDPFYHPWYGGYGYWRPYWRYYGGAYGWRGWDPFWGSPFWGSSVDVRTVDKFEASAEIVMNRGPKPADDVRAFDAKAVIDNLRPRIQYPEPRA